MIRVDHGDWSLELRPKLGGCVSRLTRQGRDVLRPMPDGSDDILSAACFPLVPFANRIADGRFDHDGRMIALPVLDTFAPHALHGQAWREAWRVTGQTARTVTLAYSHNADAWPWRYEAIQTFTLTDDGLRIDLTIVNMDETDIPVGLGLHPYFPVGAETTLSLSASAVWAVDEGLIPTHEVPPSAVHDWASGPRVLDAPFVDHCYVGWGGEARLADQELTTTLRASDNARWAHVYASPEGGFCCVEPVTHRPDAVHAPQDEVTGLQRLAPGETMSVWMTIAVA